MDRVGSNLLGQLRSMGTNGGTGTNGFDDTSIWATNVTDVASSNMAREAWTYMSNLITGGTNLVAAYSNQASYYSGNSDVIALNGYSGDASAGANSLWSGLGGWFAEPAADSPWGVVSNSFFRWDLKKAISLEVIDEHITGFRGWMKIAIMWGALLYAMRTFIEELRMSVVQALTIPQTTNLEPHRPTTQTHRPTHRRSHATSRLTA